jgi:hypothetical protein
VASCVGPGSVRPVSRPEAFCVDMLRLLRAPFEDVIPAVSVGVLDVNFQLQVFRVGVPAAVEVAGSLVIPLHVRCEFGPTRVQPIPQQ